MREGAREGGSKGGREQGREGVREGQREGGSKGVGERGRVGVREKVEIREEGRDDDNAIHIVIVNFQPATGLTVGAEV